MNATNDSSTTNAGGNRSKISDTALRTSQNLRACLLTRWRPGIKVLLFSLLLGSALVIAGSGTSVAQCLTPSFGPPNIFPAGDGPQAAVAGDFDEDGIPDLAVAHENSFDIYIFLSGVNLVPT